MSTWTRAAQKFTVIQAVALVEFDGITTPNAYANLPLIEFDPARPAVTPGANPVDPKQYDYWDHLEARRGRWLAFQPRLPGVISDGVET